MYLCPSESVRGVELLCKDGQLEGVIFTYNNYKPFVRRCLQFPAALYRFASAHFGRHRAIEKKSPVYNFVCNIPLRGDFNILLELHPSGTNRSVEANG